MANPSMCEGEVRGQLRETGSFPGMELGLSGWVAGAFTCPAILLALMVLLSIVLWVGEKPPESTTLDAFW